MKRSKVQQAAEAMHPFERAGLGRAPFRYVGMVRQDIAYGRVILNREEYQRTGVRIETAPGGSCAYCGTYIINMFNVASADGRTFHVGSDCIAKVGDSALLKACDRDALKRAREKRAAKAASIKDSLPRLILRARRSLRATPHPQAWGRDEGLSLLDWALWMARHAGATGRAKVAGICKVAAMGKVVP